MFKTTKNGIFWGALGNYIALSSNILVGFLLTPYVISRLGKTAYGGWTLLLTVVSYCALLDLGVSTAVSQAIASIRHRREAIEESKILSTVILIFGCTGFLVVAGAITFGRQVLEVIGYSSSQASDLHAALVVMTMFVAVDFIGAVVSAFFSAYELFYAVNASTLIRTLCRAFLVFALLHTWPSIFSLALAYFSSSVIALLWLTASFKRKFHQICIDFKLARFSIAKSLLVFGSISSIIRLSDLFRLPLGTIFLSKWGSMGDVAVYGIAVLLLGYAISLVVAFTTVLTPRFSALNGAGAHEKSNALLRNSIQICSILSFCIIGGLVLFSNAFLIQWIGSGFEAASTVLVILALGYSLGLSQMPMINFLLGTKKHHYHAIAITIESLSNIILSFILVPSYGIKGAAIALAMPMLIVKLIVQPCYVSRITGQTIRDYLIPIGKTAMMTILILGVAFAFNLPRLAGKSVIAFLLSVILYLVVFVSVAAVSVIDRPLLADLLSRLISILHRGRSAQTSTIAAE